MRVQTFKEFHRERRRKGLPWPRPKTFSKKRKS